MENMENIESATHRSPMVGKSDIGMTFCEAINRIILGEKVTRVQWADTDVYCFLKAEVLHIHTGGKDCTWLVSSGDIEEGDWITV